MFTRLMNNTLACAVGIQVRLRTAAGSYSGCTTALVAVGTVGKDFTRRTGLPACLRPPYLDEVTRIEVTGARVPPFPSPPTSPTRAPVWQGITVVILCSSRNPLLSSLYAT